MAETPTIWYCTSDSNYTANSTFDHNLRRALASLVANVSFTSFYNTTEGRKPDQAIAAVQCRGDLDGEPCQACVSEFTTQQHCPNNRAALFAFQGCITYYRDTNFTIPQSFMNFSLPGPGAIPNPQRFRPILIFFFNNLILSATTNPSGRFFWGDKFHYTKDVIVYCTAQCVQYLERKDCKSCLDIAFIQMLKNVAYRQGGAVFYRMMCSVRYETYPFFTPSSHNIAPSSANFITSNYSPPALSGIVGTPIHKNPKVLLSYLTNKAPISGFYNDAVDQAATKIQDLCPNSKRAIIWLDRCHVKLDGMIDVYDRACQPAGKDVSSPASFNQNLRILISNLTSLATQSSPNRLFATGVSVLAESQRIYALVQCVRDIPVEGCRWCLQNASFDIEGCSHGEQGSRILRGSCNLAFGSQQFFLGDPTLVSLVQSNHEKLKYKEASSVDVGSIKEDEADYHLPQISLRTIQNATEYFSEENKLGEGGYGPVYKGKLSSGQEVAVKGCLGTLGKV
ncbi:cysteine-rich receptor-like protein kinase 6 [Nymphaea colorata]|uniref:cysteine-rich receptor-like protein kinase 6 n=1 Tax=Nymphaea colorata TaxID=210225 RepID=UPI00214ECDFD|nr:cysteine-rich receptor-like protein kinase 6 [Nymphaea colorata]